MKEPESKFIKTMIYMADNKPVMVLVRGDAELNEAKLQSVLGAKLIYKAPEDMYLKVSGGDVGFAGPMGSKILDIPSHGILADREVEFMVNAISGANKKDFHLKGLNPVRDFEVKSYDDLRVIRATDGCPRCGGALAFPKGIEVGHTFKLGTRYSEGMKAGFLTEKGGKSPFLMGCYGIGVSRVVASAIEQCHDDNGIFWPASLAPFQVIVLPLNISEPKIVAEAEKIYDALRAKGVDVLLDDRDKRAGEKFKDADLLGIPWRVTVGEKKLVQGLVEIKARAAANAEDVPLDQVMAHLLKGITVSA